MNPMTKLLPRARWTLALSSAASNHFRLKPCQSVTLRFVPLNANTTTTRIGRYRNP